MHIFITGASGFVGGATARDLVAKGHKVSAMSRSKNSDAKIKALGATPVRCDLESITSAHLQGIEAVIHAAAFVEAWGPSDAWYKSNVLGTQAILDAAQTAGVKRFIHIGTEAAIVMGQDVEGADEEYPLAPGSSYPYCATKAQAELLVREANAPDFTTIVLRPRFIWGPGDTTLLPLIEAMAKAGNWVWIGGGRAISSTTHIANLVHAIGLALTKGRGGEAYFILDDGEVSMKDMIGGMAASKGLQLPEKSAPGWLVHAAGSVFEGVWRLFGLSGEPPITRHAAMVMSRNCVLKGGKAKTEFGYKPVISREAGLAALGSA